MGGATKATPVRSGIGNQFPQIAMNGGYPSGNAAGKVNGFGNGIKIMLETESV